MPISDDDLLLLFIVILCSFKRFAVWLLLFYSAAAAAGGGEAEASRCAGCEDGALAAAASDAGARFRMRKFFGALSF